MREHAASLMVCVAVVLVLGGRGDKGTDPVSQGGQSGGDPGIAACFDVRNGSRSEHKLCGHESDGDAEVHGTVTYECLGEAQHEGEFEVLESDSLVIDDAPNWYRYTELTEYSH